MDIGEPLEIVEVEPSELDFAPATETPAEAEVPAAPVGTEQTADGRAHCDGTSR